MSFTNEDARMGVRTLVKFSSLMTGHQRRIFKELQIEKRIGKRKGTLPILSFDILNFSHFKVENKKV
jgi:hypothetical protein